MHAENTRCNSARKRRAEHTPLRMTILGVRVPLPRIPCRLRLRPAAVRTSRIVRFPAHNEQFRPPDHTEVPPVHANKGGDGLPHVK